MDLFIAVDIGSGFTKSATGVEDGKQNSLPSIVTPYPSGPVFGLEDNDFCEFDGKRFLTGESARVFGQPIKRTDTINEEWHGGDGWQALLYKAISQSFKPDEIKDGLNIIVGLPQKIFSEQKSKIENALNQTHHFNIGDDAYSVPLKGSVIPQAAAALIYNSFKQPELLNETVGVIDIGTCTTGLSVFDDGMPVFHRSTGMVVGMSDLYSLLSAKLKQEYAFTVDEAKMPKIVKSKYAMISGEKVDITKYINEAADEISKDIVEKARTAWGGGERNSSIATDMQLFLTGGGAGVFKDSLVKHIPHLKSSLGENAFYDVVLGMYSYMINKA